MCVHVQVLAVSVCELCVNVHVCMCTHVCVRTRVHDCAHMWHFLGNVCTCKWETVCICVCVCTVCVTGCAHGPARCWSGYSEGQCTSALCSSLPSFTPQVARMPVHLWWHRSYGSSPLSLSSQNPPGAWHKESISSWSRCSGWIPEQEAPFRGQKASPQGAKPRAVIRFTVTVPSRLHVSPRLEAVRV